MPQILRGVSLMMCMVPVSNIALGTLPPERIKNASGLFNLTRNLGGAVGLAVINTVLTNREDLHLQRLRESVAWGRDVAVETYGQIQEGFATFGTNAEAMAAGRLAAMVRREAMVLSFGDVFLMLTPLFILLGLSAFLVRKPNLAGGGGGH